MERPGLTIALTVQPSVVKDLAASRRLRDLGLLARFWIVLPKSNVGYRLSDPAPIPEDLRAFWRATIFAALLLPNTHEPGLLQLTGEAYEVWRDFYRKVEVELRAGGSFAACSEEACKAVGRAVRFAGNLHIATVIGDALDEVGSQLDGDAPPAIDMGLELLNTDPTRVPIAPATMEGAVALAWHSLSHMQYALAGATDTPTDDMAKRIQGWTNRRGQSTFTWSELAKNFNINHMNRRIVEDALALLTLQGHLVEVDNPRRGATGRLPGRKWGVQS